MRGLLVLVALAAPLAGCGAPEDAGGEVAPFTLQVANTRDEPRVVDVRILAEPSGDLVAERAYDVQARTKTTMEEHASPTARIRVEARSGDLSAERTLDLPPGMQHLLVRVDREVTVQLAVVPEGQPPA